MSLFGAVSTGAVPDRYQLLTMMEVCRLASDACFQITEADSNRDIRLVLATKSPIGSINMPGILPTLCARSRTSAFERHERAT